MFKSKLKITLLILLSSSTISANGFLNNLSSGMTNSNVTSLINNASTGNININDLVTDSNLPFSIECNPDVDIDFGNLTDLCGSYRETEREANSLLGQLRSGFSFGECKVKGNDSNSCRNNTIRKICSQVQNPNGKTVFGNSSSNVKSKENMLYTGGDIYFKGNQCELGEDGVLGDKIKYGQKTKKEIQEEYLAPSAVSAKSEVGGSSVFWRPGKLNMYETCIKSALSNGVRNPENVCKGEYYALPNTKSEVEEQIANASRVSLKDSTSDLGKKVNDIEKTLKASSYPECTQVSADGECRDSNYVNNVKKKMDSMVKAEEQDKIKKIEEEMATFQEHVKIATMPKYEITYPTQEVLEGLHPEQRGDFVVMANKQMHQKALFNSSIQNLTDLKKELVEISFRKAELSSRTFYPKAAIEEANRIMESGL